MIKTKIIETVEKYDDDGKLIERITTETEEENDCDKQQYYSYYGTQPYFTQPYDGGYINTITSQEL